MDKLPYHDLPQSYLRPIRKAKPNFPGSFGVKLFLFCVIVFIGVFMLDQRHVQIPYVSKLLH